MIFNNKLEIQRLEKVETLRQMGLNPYSNNSERDTTIAEFKEKNSDIFELESRRDEKRNFIVAGRIKFFRLMGKASFLKIEDESGILQIYLARDNLPNGFYNQIKKIIEVGDIIEVKGYPFVTNKGELSLHVNNLKILTKSISPLPEKYHGIADKELRYRQRYLDLIMNRDVKEVFKTRSKIVSLTRRFFEEKGFLEVETPMMHPIAGGANAKPFITHHNALGVDRYLRIAPELYLKRLIVGGFEAIFEINRNFRNEGIDHTHNPEFTMLEFYWAYKTYKDLIAITKEYFDYLFSNLNLDKKLQYGDIEIDFNNIQEIGYIEAIEKIGGINREIIEDKAKILEFIKINLPNVYKSNTKITNKKLGELQAELFDEFVEPKLIDPTFIVDFPIDISPLARRSDKNPNIAERFEFFIAKTEIANGFSELNDPIDQYKRFEAQMEAKESGDDEAHEMDEDFVRALGYGMSPTAGEGIGIDRLTMLLTNQYSIRDVLLFPAMRQVNKINKEEESNE